jgi:hypothetical protein
MALGPVPTWRGGSRIPDRERCRLQAAEEKNILYVERSMDMVQARGGKKRPRSSHPVVLAREAGGQHGKEGLGGGVNCSVYVNGLPAGITVTRLEQIFSAHGKVRRSKFYKAGAGGDALVTFAKPNSAKMAALRLNGLQLPEGAKLEVRLQLLVAILGHLTHILERCHWRISLAEDRVKDREVTASRESAEHINTR